MDFFGIGAAVKGAAQIYFRSARQSGRTTSLLDSLKDGDRVYFATGDMSRWFERKCKERSLKVECVVIPVSDPAQVFNRGSSQGRAVFDHDWVEQLYLKAIEKCEKDIALLERETSGFGEAHRETRRRAEEINKWHIQI